MNGTENITVIAPVSQQNLELNSSGETGGHTDVCPLSTSISQSP